MVVVWYKLMRALNSSVFAQILAVLKCLCVSDRMIESLLHVNRHNLIPDISFYYYIQGRAPQHVTMQRT